MHSIYIPIRSHKVKKNIYQLVYNGINFTALVTVVISLPVSSHNMSLNTINTNNHDTDETAETLDKLG